MPPTVAANPDSPLLAETATEKFLEEKRASKRFSEKVVEIVGRIHGEGEGYGLTRELRISVKSSPRRFACQWTVGLASLKKGTRVLASRSAAVKSHIVSAGEG